MSKQLLCLIGLVFSSFFCFGQTDTSQVKIEKVDHDELEEAFDDGGLSDIKNAIKIDLAALMAGSFTISYERQIAGIFWMEVGGGPILSYLGIEYPNKYGGDLSAFSDDEISAPSGGINFYLMPKVVGENTIFTVERSSLGLLYRYRKYKLDPPSGSSSSGTYEVTVNDFALYFGMVFELSDRLFFELAYGLGVRSTKYSEDLELEKANDFVVPLGLNIGYTL